MNNLKSFTQGLLDTWQKFDYNWRKRFRVRLLLAEKDWTWVSFRASVPKGLFLLAKVWCILDLLLIIGFIDGNAVIEASLSGSSIFLQKLRLSEVRATSWCCKRWCEMIQIWTLCGGLWFIFSKVCRCYKLFLITPSSQRNDVGEADERFVAYVFVSTSFISSVKIAHSTAAEQ